MDDDDDDDDDEEGIEDVKVDVDVDGSNGIVEDEEG